MSISADKCICSSCKMNQSCLLAKYHKKHWMDFTPTFKVVQPYINSHVPSFTPSCRQLFGTPTHPHTLPPINSTLIIKLTDQSHTPAATCVFSLHRHTFPPLWRRQAARQLRAASHKAASELIKLTDTKLCITLTQILQREREKQAVGSSCKHEGELHHRPPT